MLITITGVDHPGIVDHLPSGVEYGVLWTMSDKRGHGRYPSLTDLGHTVDLLRQRKDVGIALHVCGSGARRLLKNAKVKHDRQHIDEVGFMDRFDRIQVNGVLSEDELRFLCLLYPDHEIIIQFNEHNQDLNNMRYYCDNVRFLLDDSGGRGETPENWGDILREFHLNSCGFAGGLGPHNLEKELPRIRSVIFDREMNFYKSWIDMESKVRNQDDRLSVDKVKEVVRIFSSTVDWSNWSSEFIRDIFTGKTKSDEIDYECKLRSLRYLEYTNFFQSSLNALGVK